MVQETLPSRLLNKDNDIFTNIYEAKFKLIFLLCGILLVYYFSLFYFTQKTNNDFILLLLLVSTSFLFIASFLFLDNFIRSKINKCRVKELLNKEHKDSDTAVIIGNENWLSSNNWPVSPFFFDFKRFFKILALEGTKFDVFTDLTEEKFDDVIKNPKYTNLYLFGHGSKNSFKFNGKQEILYKKYDGIGIRKDYVAQYHCNDGEGPSLIETIVPKQKQAQCTINEGMLWSLVVNHNIKKQLRKINKKFLE